MNKNPKSLLPFIAVFFCLYTFFSCNSSDKENKNRVYRSSTGPINTITVVADTTTYKAIYPFLIEPEVLGRVLPGSILPQSLYAIRNYTPKDFNKSSATRIILSLKKGEPNIVVKPEQYAQHQAYIEIYGNSLQDIQQQIIKNKTTILEEVDKANFTFLKDKIGSSKQQKLVQEKGLFAKIPSNYKIVENSPNYIWFRKDVVRTNAVTNKATASAASIQNIETTNVQIVTTKVKKEPTIESIKELVNAYALFKLKGNTDSTYVQIQKYDNEELFITEKTSDTKKYTIFTYDGMWEMKDELYGGPLLGKIIYNKNTQEMHLMNIVINAPNPDNKRENIMHGLTLLYTFKVFTQ